ncbi:hypothetical protein QEN19_003989 [Hanseniaspora menglaensis]
MKVKRSFEEAMLVSNPSINVSQYIRFVNSRIFASLNNQLSGNVDTKLNQYKQIRFMRSMLVTTVDTKGCLHTPLVVNFNYKIVPTILNLQLQILISLILSPQTKDEMTVLAFENLFKNSLIHNSTEGLSFDYLKIKNEDEIDALISKVGFHKRKAKCIKELAFLDGGIPLDYESLLALNGVGPKIAMLTLQNAIGEVAGIGVDTHVNRFSSKFEWINHKNGRKPLKNAEETRKLLENSIVPQDIWAEFNLMLVGFGQDICTSNKIPKCDICLVKNCKDRRTEIDSSLNIISDIEDLDIGFKSKHTNQWLELCQKKYDLKVRDDCESILGDWDLKFSKLNEQLNGFPLLQKEEELQINKRLKVEVKIEQSDFFSKASKTPKIRK